MKNGLFVLWSVLGPKKNVNISVSLYRSAPQVDFRPLQMGHNLCPIFGAIAWAKVQIGHSDLSRHEERGLDVKVI